MIEREAKVEPARADTLEQLVAARGIGAFAPFLVSGEGTALPNGDEESSGYVLDSAGRVFRFWLAWDDEQGAPALTVWRQVDQPGRWREHPEYRRAQALLGAG